MPASAHNSELIWVECGMLYCWFNELYAHFTVLDEIFVWTTLLGNFGGGRERGEGGHYMLDSYRPVSCMLGMAIDTTTYHSLMPVRMILTFVQVHGRMRNLIFFAHFPTKFIIDFSGRGDFSLGVNMVSNSIPPKTLSDESINQGLVCAHMHFIARTQKILTFMS